MLRDKDTRRSSWRTFSCLILARLVGKSGILWMGSIPHPACPCRTTLLECLVFSKENAQCAQSFALPCGNMNCNTGHRPECFPDPEPLRHENSGTQSLCAVRHVCQAQTWHYRFLTANSWP